MAWGVGPGRPGWLPTQVPGSQGALLLPSPLRTARKPFGLCRSSLSQGPSRDPVVQYAPPARYWSGADGRDTPETAPAASCRHLLCLPSQLFRRSRAETPEGSQPAFAWDDLAGGLNPYPLDYRAAFASSLILYPPSHRQPPCGGPTPRGGRRAYHVPRMNHGWFRLCLSAGGRNGDGRGWENPLAWPRTFWFKPLSAFGLLDLTTFISSSLESAMPSTLAPDRLGVSSRRVPSRGARPPGKGEVTLSQELRTAGLLRPHVLVGSGGHTSGCVLVVNPVTTDTSVVSCHSPHRSGLAHHAHPVPLL